MNFRAFLVAGLAALAQADASSIDHDKAQPLAQPKHVTDSEKAAVKFKPLLQVSYGCEPYPAVQANGSVSDGLNRARKSDGDCEGSSLGSQVYSRSD
ncbi:hypothetical protein PF003_g17590 [Phytophthora fragariae]|nr:hypothetical protein PF003_g17590 [Phytophthora fragariae]